MVMDGENPNWRKTPGKVDLHRLPAGNESLRRAWPDVGGFAYEFSIKRFGRGIIRIREGTVEVFTVGPGKKPKASLVGPTGPTVQDVTALTADLFEFAGSELARLVVALGIETTTGVDAGWRALGRLFELRLVQEGFRSSNKIGEARAHAMMVAVQPPLDPDRVRSALVSCGVEAERADVTAGVLEHQDDTADALSLLAGDRPGMRRLDVLADAAFDAGWKQREIDNIDWTRHELELGLDEGWTLGNARDFAIPSGAEDMVLTLRTNGCGHSRARVVVTDAGPPWEWSRLPVDIVARYGPRRTEPQELHVEAAVPLQLIDGVEEPPEAIVHITETIRAGWVPITVSWSEDGGVSRLSLTAELSSTDGIRADTGSPDAVTAFLDALARAASLNPGDVIDLWDDLSAPPPKSGARPQRRTPGWVGFGAVVLAMRARNEKPKIALQRKVLAALVREPSVIANDPVLLDELDVSPEHRAVLQELSSVAGSRLRFRAAADQQRAFGLPESFWTDLSNARRRDDEDYRDRRPDPVGDRRRAARKIIFSDSLY